MKLPLHLFSMTVAAAFVAAPLAMADKSAETAVEVEPQPADEGEIIGEEGNLDDTGIVDDGEVVEIVEDGEVVDGGDGEVTITSVGCEHESGAGICEKGEDGTVCEGEVPIDWVKRGGDTDDDLIFYNTAVDIDPTAAESGRGNPELGEDDRATQIEDKNAAGMPMIQRTKKGPVALVKKGRVFLR